MIQETCLEIEVLSERHERERLERYARRHKIQQIDELLNEFEMLNLADEVAVPSTLRARAARIVVAEQHALALRPPEEVRIVEWMDALYDIQDSLMLTVEDDIE
jgi:hypothetical protein